MPVYQDTPLATQQINQTQAPIRTNFQSIEQLVDINHVDFSDPVNYGKHAVVAFFNQATPLVPPSTDINVFCSQFTATSQAELFLQRSSGALYPITAANIGSSGGNSYGWTYFPSGIIIKWGQINGNFPNGTWQQFTYPTSANIPVFTNVFNVSLQSVSTDVPPGSQQYTYNYLTVASNFSATGFWWIPRTNFGNVNQQSLFYYAIGD
jgi:hypothetical protein